MLCKVTFKRLERVTFLGKRIFPGMLNGVFPCRGIQVNAGPEASSTIQQK